MRAALTVISFDFAKSPFADEYNQTSTINSRYGFGVNGKISFVHPYIKASLFGSFVLSPLVISGKGNQTDINTRVTLGLPSFTGPFALSVGYRRYTTDGVNVALYKKVAGASLGLGVNDIHIMNNFTLDFFADWNLVSIMEKTVINFAFDTALNMRYAFPLKPNLDLFVENQSTFDGLIIDSKCEWTVKTDFSVGVSFNDN